MVDRRAAGLPLEHVLGWAEFRGLRIAVDPGVFVPRRRTEFLVEQAVALAAAAAAVVVDLCCGSGAVGAALAAALGPARAARRRHRPRRGTLRPPQRRRRRGQVYEGDLYAPLPARCGAGSTSWPPTCPTCRPARSGCCPPEAREHEARVALDGGDDGLDVLRRVAAGAARLARARRPPAGGDQRAPGPARRRRRSPAAWSHGWSSRRSVRHRRHRDETTGRLNSPRRHGLMPRPSAAVRAGDDLEAVAVGVVE